MTEIELLQFCLIYDYSTGKLFWAKKRYHIPQNTEAGTLCKGRRQVTINRKIYQQHRLIWLLHYKALPKGEIDHKDRDPLNNRIDNLRDVAHGVNMKNKSVRVNNTTGVSGVSLQPSGKWRARIKVNGEDKHLGLFKDFEDAVKARKDAELLYGFL